QRGFESGRELVRRSRAPVVQEGEPLGQGEGLDQVVVGAEIEAAYPIVDAVPGGQNQYRRDHNLVVRPCSAAVRICASFRSSSTTRTRTNGKCYRAKLEPFLTFVSGTRPCPGEVKGTSADDSNGMTRSPGNDCDRTGSASSSPYTTEYARSLGVKVPKRRSYRVSTLE